jgi:hypothetical protein
METWKARGTGTGTGTYRFTRAVLQAERELALPSRSAAVRYSVYVHCSSACVGLILRGGMACRESSSCSSETYRVPFALVSELVGNGKMPHHVSESRLNVYCPLVMSQRSNDRTIISKHKCNGKCRCCIIFSLCDGP